MLINPICRPPFVLSKMEPHVFFVAIDTAGRPVPFDENLIMFLECILGYCFPYKFTAVGIGFVGLMLPCYGKKVLTRE